ncbi:MAG TPA: hypothetical protein VMU47_19900 [Caldimonas sp.]|nr:hypothetical protein [Caldimonas sp.]
MPDIDPQALAPVQPVLRQLREIKGVREARPGVFLLRGKPFVSFRLEGGVLQAELVKSGGAGFDRLMVVEPPQQRKLVDEAKLRAKRLDEE